MILLLSAVAFVLVRGSVAWLSSAAYCGKNGCLHLLFQQWDWLSFPARALFCLVPVLLLIVPVSRQPRQGAVFRFWPIYLFLLLLALIVGRELLSNFIVTTMATSPTGFDAMGPWLRLLYIGYFFPPLSTIIIVITAWLLTSWACFTDGVASNASPQGRRALLVFSLFAALAMAGLGWLNAYLRIFTTSSYSLMVSHIEQAMGARISWSILLTPIVMALPVWAVVWWRDPEDHGLKGTVPIAVAALVLSIAFAVIGLIVISLGLPNSARSVRGIERIAWYWATWILVADALAAWMICAIVRTRRPGVKIQGLTLSPRIALAAVNAAVVILTFGLVGIVAAGKLGWTGPQPPRTIAAKDTNSAQIGTPYESNCDGIVRAADGLWYVGYSDSWSSLSDIKQAKSLRDIASVATDADGHTPAYKTYSRDHFTVLSHLKSDGKLEPVMYVRGKACLVPTSGSGRLLLMTDLRRLDENASVTFETLDGGRHWHEYTSSALAHLDVNGAYFQANFANPRQVWLTYSPYSWDTKPPYIGLSEDGGRTANAIPLPAGAVSSSDDVTKVLPVGSRPDRSRRSDTLYFLTEVSADKVVLWVSQQLNYRAPKRSDGTSPWHQSLRTDELVLGRHQGVWTVEQTRHINGLYISKLGQVPGKPTYAVVKRSDSSRTTHTTIARLNDKTLDWDDLSSAPNPFWPLGASGIRDLWVTQNTVVVEVRAGFSLPQRHHSSNSLNGITISTSAYYYADNNGQSWHKLAIDRYPGALGVDPVQDRLYFQNLDLRSDTSPMYALDLKP